MKCAIASWAKDSFANSASLAKDHLKEKNGLGGKPNQIVTRGACLV